jgi:hypothetical protein
MDAMYRGMWLVAYNDSTSVEVNTFEEAAIAFEIFGTAAIGDQYHNGNEWYGNYSVGYGGYIGGNDPIGTAINSKFYIDESDEDACVLYPCPIGPAEVDNHIWFEDQDSLAKSCISIDDPDNPIAGTLANLILTELDFEVYNNELN